MCYFCAITNFIKVQMLDFSEFSGFSPPTQARASLVALADYEVHYYQVSEIEIGAPPRLCGL